MPYELQISSHSILLLDERNKALQVHHKLDLPSELT